jgi:hypothetical protein
MKSKKTEKIKNIANGFVYDWERPPEANYLNFEDSTSFYKKMEFYSSDDKKPIIYLASTPLGNDISTAKFILKAFYDNLKKQLDEILSNEPDMFKLYQNYFHLYNVVATQYNEYLKNKMQFFGPNMTTEFSYKKIKELKVPIRRSYYYSPLPMGNTVGGIQYEMLGNEIKSFFAQLYKLKKKANIEFMKYLAEIRDMIFYNRGTKYYRYKGNTTDIIEIGIMLLQSGNVQGVVHGANDGTNFCKHLCFFMGVPYTKFNNYIETIASKSSKNDLFIREGKELIRNYLDKPKKAINK